MTSTDQPTPEPGTDAVGTAVRTVTAHFEANPREARFTDSAATATLDGGLRCRVTGPGGWALASDMHPRLGGQATAPLPSWLLRAAIASCTATTIAMRAAALGIELSDLDVAVDGDTDLRGMLGVGEGGPVGPLEIRVAVSIDGDATREQLGELVAWGTSHSPVVAAVAKAVDMPVRHRRFTRGTPEPQDEGSTDEHLARHGRSADRQSRNRIPRR